MTAVQVQQHGCAHRQQYNPRQSPHSSNISSPHQSRPQSYTSPGPSQLQRQEPPIQNGTSGPMNPRPAVSNDPVQVVNGQRSSPPDGDYRRSSTASGRAPPVAGHSARDSRASSQSRPTSAPGVTADSSQDDSEVDRIKRRPKHLLQRSKSDFGLRGEDVDSPAEEDWQGWGARHGFEDHYASEEYVSQLANVGCSFLCLQTLSCDNVLVYVPRILLFRRSIGHHHKCRAPFGYAASILDADAHLQNGGLP
jgi:regulatory associated protein of mTOR